MSPLRDDVRQALAIDASSAIEDRTIDITTTGRRSGEPRRIEIVFYRLGDDIYLSGIPGPKTRDWLANLAAQPKFTFHLKHRAVADLPATAAVIGDQAERGVSSPSWSSSSTAAAVLTVRGRRPSSMSGWSAARWPRSPSRSPTDNGRNAEPPDLTGGSRRHGRGSSAGAGVSGVRSG